MKSYELRVNKDTYDILAAEEDGHELIWHNGDGRLKKGDIVYIITGRGHLHGKATCGIQTVIRDESELPGGRRYWNFESDTLQKQIEQRNFIKLINYQSVIPEGTELPKVEGKMNATCEIPEKKYANVRFVPTP